MARFIFLNPRAAEFFHGWEQIANDAVAILRAEAGRNHLRPTPLRPYR
jgi:hypothetical protein